MNLINDIQNANGTTDVLEFDGENDTRQSETMDKQDSPGIQINSSSSPQPS